jgi:hypothetical protein
MMRISRAEFDTFMGPDFLTTLPNTTCRGSSTCSSAAARLDDVREQPSAGTPATSSAGSPTTRSAHHETEDVKSRAATADAGAAPATTRATAQGRAALWRHPLTTPYEDRMSDGRACARGTSGSPDSSGPHDESPELRAAALPRKRSLALSVHRTGKNADFQRPKTRCGSSVDESRGVTLSRGMPER